jgi:hypothetical protein
MVFSILSILFKGYSTGLSISIALLALIMLLLIIAPRREEFDETTRQQDNKTTRQNIRDKLEKLNDEEIALIFTAFRFLNYANLPINKLNKLSEEYAAFNKMVDNELKHNTRNNHITILVDPPDSFRFRNSEKLVTALIAELPFLKSVYYSA